MMGVTQINIGSVKLYLSPVLDMFNDEIISQNLLTSNRFTICLTRLSHGLTLLMGLYSILVTVKRKESGATPNSFNKRMMSKLVSLLGCTSKLWHNLIFIYNLIGNEFTSFLLLQLLRLSYSSSAGKQREMPRIKKRVCRTQHPGSWRMQSCG